MTVTRDIAATRQRVWDVMANGWTHSGWVLGNSRIRAVDSNWPAPGTRIHRRPARRSSERGLKKYAPGSFPITVVLKVAPPEAQPLFRSGAPRSRDHVSARNADPGRTADR
jgi:hypothetical protein